LNIIIRVHISSYNIKYDMIDLYVSTDNPLYIDDLVFYIIRFLNDNESLKLLRCRKITIKKQYKFEFKSIYLLVLRFYLMLCLKNSFFDVHFDKTRCLIDSHVSYSSFFEIFDMLNFICDLFLMVNLYLYLFYFHLNYSIFWKSWIINYNGDETLSFLW